MLSLDLNLLEYLIDINKKQSLEYFLHIDDLSYPLSDVSIINSPTPVNSPTTRGGVYFSDKFAYKIKGTVNNLDVVPLLSKTMLGPNTEFRKIRITTQIIDANKKNTFTIFTNLTNSVQSSSKIELNMILISLELTNLC